MLEKDDLEYEGQESPDTEFIIDPIDETRKSLNFGLYALLNALKNFYSRIQDSYKKVTLTWLIASLIGMGFLFSQKAGNLPVSIFYIAIFIQFITMWGITLLWFIDISIYQTYFYGVVLEELKLERENEWLPKINTNIGNIQTNPRKRISQSFFYLGCDYILLIFMCIISFKVVHFQIFHSILILIFFILLGFALTFVMLKVEHPKKKSPLGNQIKKIFNNSNNNKN